MKIAQIVSSIDPHRGGKERYVGDLINELVKLGHEVTLITCDQKYKADINYDIRYVRKLTLPSGLEIPSFKDLIKQLDSRFDVCHLHYHAIFGEMVALANKMHNSILITTIHDEMKRGIHKIIYDKVLLKTISNLSHRIVCLTEGMKKELARRGLDERKIIVISNVLYVKKLQNEFSKLKKDVYVDGDFHLLFVGRLEKRKGIQHLLRALLILKEENFKPTIKIVGEGVLKQKLISFVQKNNLSSQVVFTGYISRKELLKYYHRARCVVIPSIYEGTPNRVAIEALALGNPVIITSIPGNEPIISKRLGFIGSPRNPESLARAIRNALSIKSDELYRIKVEGEKFAEQYDWSHVITKIVLLYQNTLKEKYL
ncbi:MAG: glycosyltransferase family 4 protein [Candidatus Hodarchaeota archaeon]